MSLSTRKRDTAIATSKPKVGAYFEPEVYEALEAEAEYENRSMSQMTTILVREALIARGVLEDDKKPKKRRIPKKE